MLVKVLLVSTLVVACWGQIVPQSQNGFPNNNGQVPPVGFPPNGQSPFNNNNNQPNAFPLPPPGQNGVFNGQQPSGGFGFGQGVGPQGSTFESSNGQRGSGGYQGPNGGWSYSYDSAISAAEKVPVKSLWMMLLAIFVGGLVTRSV